MVPYYNCSISSPKSGNEISALSRLWLSAPRRRRVPLLLLLLLLLPLASPFRVLLSQHLLFGFGVWQATSPFRVWYTNISLQGIQFGTQRLLSGLGFRKQHLLFELWGSRAISPFRVLELVSNISLQGFALSSAFGFVASQAAFPIRAQANLSFQVWASQSTYLSKVLQF